MLSEAKKEILHELLQKMLVLIFGTRCLLVYHPIPQCKPKSNYEKYEKKNFRSTNNETKAKM